MKQLYQKEHVNNYNMWHYRREFPSQTAVNIQIVLGGVLGSYPTARLPYWLVFRPLFSPQ